MLHRFRVAMVRTSREPLAGQVEVDETMIGGVAQLFGRSTSKEANEDVVQTKNSLRLLWKSSIPKDLDGFGCDMPVLRPNNAFLMRLPTVWNHSFAK